MSHIIEHGNLVRLGAACERGLFSGNFPTTASLMDMLSLLPSGMLLWNLESLTKDKIQRVWKRAC
jgi:hypothetical protein